MLSKDCLFFGLRKLMTEEQETFVNSILTNNVTFCNAVAGSGKTTMSVAALKYLYDLGKIDKVYYIFSPVMEGVLGHRPGTTEEKEADYVQPLKDALIKIGELPEKAMDPRVGWVEAKSDTFLRGTNMERAGVIIDEAQNWTKAQFKRGLSRIHDNCHVVIIGHDGQIDLPKEELSGFRGAIDHFLQNPNVRLCRLTKNFRGWISQLADTL